MKASVPCAWLVLPPTIEVTPEFSASSTYYNKMKFNEY